MNDRLNELIEKITKSMGARTIKHKELKNVFRKINLLDI